MASLLQWKTQNRKAPSGGFSRYTIEIEKECFFRHNSDLALEYLEVAFFAQKIAEVADIINISIEERNAQYKQKITFNVRTKQFGTLNYTLQWLQHYSEQEEFGDYDEISYVEELDEFQDAIIAHKIKPSLPDYCDSFFANYIADILGWDEDEQWHIGKLHPTWRFHAWKSAWSNILGFDLYVSPEYWILPKNGHLRRALQKASEIRSPPKFLIKPDHCFVDGINILLILPQEVLLVPLESHRTIFDCATSVCFPSDQFQYSSMPLNYIQDFEIAPDLSFLTCKTPSFSYLLFRDAFHVLSQNEIDQLHKNVLKNIDYLFDKSSTTIKQKVDWNRLDPERFEKLCRDLVAKDSRFFKREIRKMGKATSRDEGRDIVLTEYARAGAQEASRQAWIIQCKFSSISKSLGRNAINISELINEHNPAGIIIATNTTIDAGTYDKHDKIHNNTGITIEHWDGAYIERMLNKHADLRQIYIEP